MNNHADSHRMIACILRKEYREHQRRHGLGITLGMVGIMWIANLVFISRYLAGVFEPGALRIFVNSAATHQAVSFAMVVCFVLLPSLYTRERSCGALESLMVTPVSIVDIWLAKTIFIVMVATSFCWIVSSVGLGVLNLLVNRGKELMLPAAPAVIFLVFLLPAIVATTASLLGLMQLITPNPSFSLMVYLWIAIGYMAITSSQMRVFTITWQGLIPYMGLLCLLVVVVAAMFKRLSRERVLLAGC